MANDHTNLAADRGAVPDFVNRGAPAAATIRSPARLRVRGLSLSRGDHCLIRSLSFDLPAGRVLQITGPNGCGKTTLLRAVAGLSRPDAGDILWDPAEPQPPDIAYLGHRNGLKSNLTPREELGFALSLHNRRGAGAIDDALQRVGLERCADRPCGELSAGQQRRVALARVLLAGCPVWILDEPLTALDAEASRSFQDLLAQHLRDGGIALLSTHYPLAIEPSRTDSLALEALC